MRISDWSSDVCSSDLVEAVLEDPEVKRDLYKRLESVRKDGSIVSSNTSTLPLTLLTEGLPERFARDFLITHFFNPPRYMALLELVAGEKTRPEARSEEHTSELQSLMRISYAVFCLKKQHNLHLQLYYS